METRNQRLKRALKEQGISQEQVAKSLGRARASVTELLNNKKEVDSYILIETISNLTGLSMRYLAHGDDISMAAEPAEDYYLLKKKMEEIKKLL